MKEYGTAVIIGRFQPLHNAHLHLINEAKKLAHQVVVLVGSAGQPRSCKNPFSFAERQRMINATQNPHDSIVIVEPLYDSIYNDNSWKAQVQEIVSYYDEQSANFKEKIVLVGHKKDDSSYYLDYFPQWNYKEIETLSQLDATSIRSLYFVENVNMDFITGVVPNEVFNILADFTKTDEFSDIVEEQEFLNKYKKQFENYPYPPVFVTTDAVVTCSGHVLMIKRRGFPGKGQLAIPGGFLDVKGDKTILDCALRELKEETNIKVPLPVLKGSIVSNKVFDHPDRSSRGRTITHAFHIDLADKTLPKVKGGDDAKNAMWIPIGTLERSLCYEDHFQIIEHFIGR